MSGAGLRPLMVLGCTSGAGKSLLVTALCRWFSDAGLRVVPFKAQNMANNARVVEGGEIGVAQWLQARAARAEPTVDMNPVLLKPEADTRSQVVVHGKPDLRLTRTPWRERGATLWPVMAGSFDRLRSSHDLVIIEGAGSPAEINLPDLVNKRVLQHSDASALLTVDIDRGGAFAHLVGTWELVDDETRRRLAGFVLNKFRGDASLLAPAPAQVAERTGMSDLGVLPMVDHLLPDEEGATIRGAAPVGSVSVAIVRYPFASNLDEWHLLPHAAHVRWATRPGDLAGADLVVLPGSKHVAADLDWLRRTGLADAVTGAAARGVRVLGVCGGAMMLGGSIGDDHGVEAPAHGLELLPITTEMAPDKHVAHTSIVLPEMPPEWAELSGREVDGYEIRHGVVHGAALAPGFWASGNVLATTVHGAGELPDVVEGLVGVRPPDVLDGAFDQLAAAIDEHLDLDRIAAWTGLV